MHCFYCNSNNIKYLFNSTDYSSKETFKIFRCESCHLDFPDPRPQNIDHYYPKKYRDYNKPIKLVFKYIYGLLAKKVNSLFKFKKGKKILEIGCGSGILLEAFKNLGWKVTGLERKEFVDNLKTNNLSITSKNISEFSDNYFDLIYLNNSLEHLKDLSFYISMIKKKLKSRGFIIINIPSSNSIQYKFGKGYWFHLDVPRHLQIFNDKFFYRVADENNFKIIKKTSIGFFWELFGWFQTINNKLFKNKNKFFRSLSNFEEYKINFFLGLIQLSLFILPCIILTFISFITNKGSIKQFVIFKD